MPPEHLADILTNTGLEVEEIEQFESVKGGLKDLVIGEVRSVEKHPNADKLVITKTYIGGDEDLQIVCGAPNVAAGQKVIVAPVGSTIHPIDGEPFKIRKAKIRGEESFGMICAEDEIGLGHEHDGIMVLNGDAVAGQLAVEYFDIETDVVFEIGLTPNRSDAMSHIGVARDVVAAMNSLFDAGLKLKKPNTSDFSIDNHDLPIKVSVKDQKACPRYSGISISGVEVKPSPDWMQKSLMAVGVRPINNIVDVTNYVLHEYGQPLHAFDADKIKGKEVIVQQLPEGSIFKALDESERKLSAEDLMICDSEGGMCIAGVFGGIGSGVSDSTTNIFLESAYFSPTSIRRTSTRHDLRTDAATHYEKGTDPSMTIEIMKRAALLIKEVAGGNISSEIIDIYPDPIYDFDVVLSRKNFLRLSGIEIEDNKIKQILSDLDITVVKKHKTKWDLQVPVYRTDVLREQDVIEEILRIYGYNQVPIPLKLNSSIVPGGNEEYKLENRISTLLRGIGFNELFANSITKSAHYDEKELEQTVVLANSMTAQLDILRSNMLYGGLEVIAYNMNRQINSVKLYEFGKTYHRSGDSFKENKHLALFLSGDLMEESWAAKSQKIEYQHMKAAVDETLKQFGIDSWKQQEIEKDEHLSEGVRYLLGEDIVATFGKLKATVLKKAGIKNEVYYADLEWDKMKEKNEHKKVRFSEIPKYPQIRRDLALLVNESVKFAEIESLARKLGKNILQEVNLFDVYRGKNLEEGKKSYAVSYVFQDLKKTLTDEEIETVMTRLIDKYKEELNAEIR
ncbi:MAG: phenylalanine--tRNA ligase subunit beta [Chitinophagales bacterium]|nr:phenylalanine--tRNA ligase subunit beta [Chitinophagales bacterium]